MTGPASIADALRDGARTLSGAGIDGARLDARLLLGHALGRDVWPHESALVPDERLAAYRLLIERRAAREPVARILGRRAFWTLDLALSPDTLVPRPDTETLIEAAVDWFRDRAPPRRILDLGSGSGCLLLAALSEFEGAHGLGVDLSAGAVATARANAETNGLAGRAEFVIGNWSDLDYEPADLVLSNPPYIPTGDLAGLEVDVARHDPALALDGGPDGLDAYRTLGRDLPRLLADDGVAILEIGQGQAESVPALLRRAGLRIEAIRPDLAGIPRAVIATR